MGSTHAGAAEEDHAEGLHDAGNPHHPGEAQEQDDPEDVLETGQVDAHEGAHPWSLWRKQGAVRAQRAAPMHARCCRQEEHRTTWLRASALHGWARATKGARGPTPAQPFMATGVTGTLGWQRLQGSRDLASQGWAAAQDCRGQEKGAATAPCTSPEPASSCPRHCSRPPRAPGCPAAGWCSWPARSAGTRPSGWCPSPPAESSVR